MSFSKLFGSILDSTVWQTPAHVRLVWITMLAMKDRDGIVSAAIPGLARRAIVSLEECEDALKILSSPDPYSRTPDYEGRRIETVDGGWRVLNHEKYRDMLDLQERREKAAARAEKHRKKKGKPDRNAPSVTRHAPSRSVTLSNAGSREVRHADTDTDADPFPEGDARSGSGSRSTPVSSRPPDLGGVGDHAQVGGPSDASSPARPRSPERTESPQRAPSLDPGDSRAVEQKRVLRTLSALHVVVFNRCRAALQAQVPAMQPIGDPAERALRELVHEQITLDGFEERARHVLAVREAEAMRERSVRWLGASVWSPHQFAIAGSMQVGEDRRARKESAFDAVDQGIDAARRAGVKFDDEDKPDD